MISGSNNTTDASQASVIQSIVKVTPGWWVTPPRDAYDIVAEYEAKRGTQWKTS